MKDIVIIFCAHNDDNIIGVGGTAALYSSKGVDVISVIFSYGEKSHPWLQKKEVIRMRVEESQKADIIVGGEKTYYLGLNEGNFPFEVQERNIKDKIARFIEELKPSRIFTHSEDDFHPDHRAVYSAVFSTVEKLDYKGDVYSFDVWNPFAVRNRNRPRLVVDVTKTFRKKIQAFRLHKSQWMTMVTMIPAVYARAFFNGLEYGFTYAEVFVKIR
jgi:LmbE family N-acetylglucosaminyl deacetylase